MSSVRVPLTPESNSGAHFLYDETYFHKCGLGLSSERVKAQALWISKLALEQSQRFPSIAFIYWSADTGVIHTSELLTAPTALSWFLGHSEQETTSACEVVRTAVKWVQGTLHQPGPRVSNDSTRLVLRQTEDRILKQWRLEPRFRSLLESDFVSIGGKVVRGVVATMRAVSDLVGTGAFDSAALSTVHGDIHLGNILTDLCRWWLIDPRGSFAGGHNRFDPYYEWGKLLHDCHGLYGLICSGALRAEVMSASHVRLIGPSATDRIRYATLLRDLVRLLDDGAAAYGEPQLCRRKVLVYEGLILLGIVPFHQENQLKALTIACVGLLMLDRALRGGEPDLVLDWLG